MAKGDGKNGENKKINFTGWGPNPICPQTKRSRTPALCRLPRIECSHHLKPLPVTLNAGTTREGARRSMVHEIGPQKRVQPHQDPKRRRMENSVQNPVRTLRIPGNALRTHQRPVNLPRHDEPCPIGRPGHWSSGLYGRLPHIRQNRGRA